MMGRSVSIKSTWSLIADFLFLIYGKFDNYPAASEEQKREFSNQSIEMENKERNKKIRKQKSLIK